jgi:hypothetical protein
VAVMIQHLTFALAFLQPSSKKAFAELGDLKSDIGCLKSRHLVTGP